MSVINGIKVYILHDCDIAGYLIEDKFKSGSSTYRKKLDVTRIGLTLEDVESLGKRGQAETVSYEKPYSDSLGILTPKERDFFVVDYYDNTFHR
jgi:hypothetical protein